MKHFIAMGGEHGCLPDNCSALHSEEDAVDTLDGIYELSEEQRDELTESWSVKLTRDQGGAYCEISECNCDVPWEHDEFGDPDDWKEDDE